MKKLIAIAVLTSVALFARAKALFCEVDGGIMLWTGNSKFENKTLYEYKCFIGHVFWLDISP
jgi:hypothetical protein